MESTIGQRIQQLREAKQLSVAKFAEVAGVKPTAIYGLERGDNKPSYDVLLRIRQHFDDLNSDWLLDGKGKMLRNLTPAPTETEKPEPRQLAEPVADYTSAAATIGHATELLLRGQMEERIKELAADKARLIKENIELRDENKLLLGKPFDSPDAADDLEPEQPTPQAPAGHLPKPVLRVQVRGLRRYQE